MEIEASGLQEVAVAVVDGLFVTSNVDSEIKQKLYDDCRKILSKEWLRSQPLLVLNTLKKLEKQENLLLRCHTTLEWMLRDIDYRNQQDEQIEDSPELKEAKELFGELVEVKEKFNKVKEFV